MSDLEWVVAVGGGLIAPFLLVTIIGCLLPRQNAVCRSIVLKQIPRSVWETITAFERIPGWWPPCMMVERLPDQNGHAVYRQSFLSGRSLRALDLEVVESVEPSRFATRIVNQRAPFRGQWIYEIAPTDSGCKITLTEQAEIANPFMRTMFRLTVNKTQLIDSYLENLARKFGEQAVPF